MCTLIYSYQFIYYLKVLTKEEIIQAAEAFKLRLAETASQYENKFVINTDQTGCEFHIMPNRTYSWKGERMTMSSAKNVSKTTHSYTAQYTVTLDKTLVPKVFICMQEPNGVFGPRVQVDVDELVSKLGNVVVTCSKSGKLSTALYQEYLNEILVPYVKDNEFLLVIDSWTGQTNADIYNRTFKDEEGNPTCNVQVIPGKCTSMCQPLDVYFYRQVKLYIKRLQNNSWLYDNKVDITSREHCIRIHSVVLHQLQAPIFQNMLEYAWAKCGVGDDCVSFLNVVEVCFPKENGKHLCECKKSVFVQCSVCRQYLCFKCFYEDFHHLECVQ